MKQSVKITCGKVHCKTIHIIYAVTVIVQVGSMQYNLHVFTVRAIY